MSADLLREAAQKMRELAEAAVPGPWMKGVAQGRAYLVESLLAGGNGEMAQHRVVAEVRRQNDAKHITAWHPDVARAVADLLDAEAQAREEQYASLRHHFGDKADGFMPDPSPYPLAVARSFLGRQS